MASTISYSNVHQLSTGDKINTEIKKKSPTSMKMLLNQQASPDSTNNNNNNNTMHQTPTTMISTPTTFSNNIQPQQQQSAPRGRGRKTSPTYVQVIPGQPVAVARRNARERNRVKQVNNGFSTLRQHIPFTARNKKMSKVETLRCAVDYIRSLQQLLDENGGYDHGELMNVSSSSPLSSIDSGEEHSLMSMGTASDVMYETQTDTVPSSSTILDEYSPSSDYTTQIRTGVILPTTKFYHNNNDVIFSDSPLPSHPNALIRHGSSLSPGYSDRSSVNNSPAALTSTEVTTTHGFMGVFAAAAAGLDKNSSGLMMDLSRNGSSNLQQTLIFKKERDMDEDERRNNLLELEGTNTTEMMEALTWWEIEQARRMQQQQQQTSS